MCKKTNESECVGKIMMGFLLLSDSTRSYVEYRRLFLGSDIRMTNNCYYTDFKGKVGDVEKQSHSGKQSVIRLSNRSKCFIQSLIISSVDTGWCEERIILAMETRLQILILFGSEQLANNVIYCIFLHNLHGFTLT